MLVTLLLLAEVQKVCEESCNVHSLYMEWYTGMRCVEGKKPFFWFKACYLNFIQCHQPYKANNSQQWLLRDFKVLKSKASIVSNNLQSLSLELSIYIQYSDRFNYVILQQFSSHCSHKNDVNHQRLSLQFKAILWRTIHKTKIIKLNRHK